MLFCPFCAQPESNRVPGNPAAGAEFVTFVCGTRAEALIDFNRQQTGTIRGLQRAIACIAFGNANPHRLEARVKELEELITLIPGVERNPSAHPGG